MKRVAAAALLVDLLLVCAMPIQAQEQPAAGPLMQAVQKEASRLVAAPRKVGPAVQNWPRVTRLAPGREIFVEARGGRAASRIFVTADESELIVLDLTHASLTSEVRRVMRDGVKTHSEYFLHVFAGSRIVHGKVRLAPDGIFVSDRKVAEISDVVKRIPRTDVVVITTPPKRRGSLSGGAIGAGVGVVLAYRAAQGLYYTDKEALLVLALVGLPIAGGVLGYQANPRTTQDVIYRADP